MKEPTERQKEVLDFIAKYIHAHMYPPTIREVAENFSISVKGAHDHLIALKKKGLLKQGDKKSRTIELIKTDEEGENFAEIPILGTVAAGRPILAIENFDGSIKLTGRCSETADIISPCGLREIPWKGQESWTETRR